MFYFFTFLLILFYLFIPLKIILHYISLFLHYILLSFDSNKISLHYILNVFLLLKFFIHYLSAIKQRGKDNIMKSIFQSINMSYAMQICSKQIYHIILN